MTSRDLVSGADTPQWVSVSVCANLNWAHGSMGLHPQRAEEVALLTMVAFRRSSRACVRGEKKKKLHCSHSSISGLVSFGSPVCFCEKTQWLATCRDTWWPWRVLSISSGR